MGRSRGARHRAPTTTWSSRSRSRCCWPGCERCCDVPTDAPAPVAVGDLRIDPGARRTWRGETEISLTARQFEVLEFLVRRAGPGACRRPTSSTVCGMHDFDGDPNIVEVYVKRLRRAIDEPFGRRSIETVRGAGYRIVDDGPAS